MNAPGKLYSQDVTNFTLRFLLTADTTLEGRLVLELADIFLDRLLFTGCEVVSIWTKAPGMGARLSMAEFSEKRWAAARKKIGNNNCAVVRLEARTAFPDQTIALYVQANPPGGAEHLGSGTVDVTCSVPYLRHLAASPEKMDALIGFGIHAWTVKPAYGFGNLAFTPKRVAFAPGVAPHLELSAPPSDRVHAIPVAQTGSDIDGNIDVLICEGRGIKGAYWSNFLSGSSVRMAGGELKLRETLEGMRVERLDDGGLLIITADSPLPDDSDENRRRFIQLATALEPAFLSRAETPPQKRSLLGCFFRE